VQGDRVTALGNFTALVAVNTPVVALVGRAHAASSWPSDSLPVSLDFKSLTCFPAFFRFDPYSPF